MIPFSQIRCNRINDIENFVHVLSCAPRDIDSFVVLSTNNNRASADDVVIGSKTKKRKYAKEPYGFVTAGAPGEVDLDQEYTSVTCGHHFLGRSAANGDWLISRFLEEIGGINDFKKKEQKTCFEDDADIVMTVEP